MRIFLPPLLSCGVALKSVSLKSAVGVMLGGVSRSERGVRTAKMQAAS